ncbi:MAG TPA: hypothetical protein VFB72_18300 [Verrucomicrobiae bacterium]|nr:hypothetical protein [Verrucomicrobiae bacterium]
MMKNGCAAAALIILLALTGCVDEPPASVNSICPRITRDDLRSRFGEPLRTEAAGPSGEIWYYRFVSWSNHPTGSSETVHDFNGQSSTVTVGWQFTRVSDERPVHISPDGYVIEPVPEGRIVQKE